MKSNSKKIVILIVLTMGFVLFPNIKLDFGDGQKFNIIHPKPSAGYLESFIHVDGNWTATTSKAWCSGDGSWSNPYIIENVTIDAISSPTGSGILINNSKSEYFIIRNTKVYNAGIAGVKLENANNGTIINNNCSNNGAKGIFLYNSYNNTISGNTANNNSQIGIAISSYCDNNTISGNTANNNTQIGIYIGSYSNNNTISGNTANDNTNCGIYIGSYSNNNTITGNTANDNDQFGIYLEYYCDNNTISGNTANDNTYCGIAIYNYCDNNTIINNTANDNTQYGIYLGVECDISTITNNTANDNGQHGIGLRSSNNTVSGNTVNNNTQYGIYLNDSHNNTISGNTANDNAQHGIYLGLNCDNNTISGNNMTHSGIYIEGSSLEEYSSHNIDITNLVNDKPIYYYANEIGLGKDNFTYAGDPGQVILANCNNSKVSNLNLSYTSIGIFLCYSNNNTISKNIVNHNTQYGIYLTSYCDDNNITENYIYFNAMGAIVIESSTCDDTIISGNIIVSSDARFITDSGTNTIIKNCYFGMISPSIIVEVLAQLFSPTEIIITINVSSQHIGLEFSELSIQGWWNGNLIPLSNIIELGNSQYNISLTPILIEPILLNMTISAAYHNDKYYEINFSVYEPEYDRLFLEITKERFDEDEFEIYFRISNYSNDDINTASIQAWWDGINVNNPSVNFYGNGNYSVRLDPIFVGPTDNAPLFNMTISAPGYSDLYYEYEIANLYSTHLHVEFLFETYSEDNFTLYFQVENNTGGLIEGATIQAWWNGSENLVDVFVLNIFVGIYYVVLEPIFVSNASNYYESIEFNMTITAPGYENFYYERNISIEMSIPPPVSVSNLLFIEIWDQSFSLEEFNITFYLYNREIQGISDADIQMWWNGDNVSSNVVELENGLYNIMLTPLFTEPGEEPILLNMSVKAIGYPDKYYETKIAVKPDSEPDEDSKVLNIEILYQLFFMDEFNITFYIFNESNHGIDNVTIQMWWNSRNISTSVQNLGSGLYFVSLEPITVKPGEDPILLEIDISASGYEDKSFETYIAVDPDILLGETGEQTEDSPLIIIIITSTSIAGGIIIIGATAFLLRRRKGLKS